MAKKFGLGAGLDALIGDYASADADKNPAFQQNLPAGIEVDSNGQLSADITLLKPNPQQPRKDFSQEELDELASSVKEHGVLQAVTIEESGDGFFYIITGERRVRAAKIAGLTRVPVQLRRFSEQKKLEVALIENIQRSDLNALEEAQAYYKLMEIGNLTQDQVAERVGKNRSTVANAIRLLKLPQDMQDALSQKKITSGHARAILAVNDEQNMRVLFDKILRGGLSVREAESSAASLNAGNELELSDTQNQKTNHSKRKSKQTNRDADFDAIEEQFRRTLGTKVALKGTLERGSLSIEYFSRADLDRLYSIITKQ